MFKLFLFGFIVGVIGGDIIKHIIDKNGGKK
jgi:hypothetical protein